MKQDSFYKNILNQSDILIFILNEKFELVFINKFTKEYLLKFGLGLEKGFKEFLHASNYTLRDLKDFLNNILPDAESENRIITVLESLETGKIKIEWRVSSLKDKNKVLYTFTGKKSLVSEGIEKNIKKECFAKLLNYTFDAIVVITPDLKIKYGNSKYTEIVSTFGINEDYIGKKIDEVFPKFNKENIIDFKIVFKSGNPVVTNEQFNFNNEILHYEISKIPVFDKNKVVAEVVVVFKDITRQKQAFFSYTKLITAVEQSPFITVITDKNGVIEYVNPQFIKTTGYKFDEVVGKKPNIFSSKSHDSSYFKKLWNNISSGKVWHGEFINRKKDGTLYREKASISSTYDGFGKIVNYVKVSEIVTDEKEIEIDLQVSEMRFKSIFENSLTGIFYINLNGEILEANPKAVEILGSPSAEATKSINVFTFKPVSEIGFAQAVRECINKKKTIMRETAYKSKWGKPIYALYYCNPIIRNGEVHGVLANLDDITEQRIAQLSLKESEERFKKLAELTFEGILIHKDVIIQDVNVSLCKMSGYTHDELIGKNGLKLLVCKKYHVEMKKRLTNNITEPIEVEAIRKDGTVFPVEIETRNIKWNGDDLRVIAIRDIARRKKIEEKLIENEKYLNDILNSFSDGIYVISSDYKIQYINKAMIDKIGYDATGETCYKALYKNNNKCEWCIYELLDNKTPSISYDMYLEDVDEHKNVRNFLLENDSKLTIYYDITQRKKAEIELKESRERFELSVNGSNDGIWDWNILTNELYVSPKWKSQIGYKDGELENEFSSLTNNLHPEDNPRVLDYINKYLKNEIKEFNIEYRLQHKSGNYIWINTRGEALRDKNGVPYRMAGSHTDITKRKLEEIQLMESEERFKKLSDLTFEGIILHNNGILIDANASFCRMSGYKLDEIVGLNVIDLIVVKDFLNMVYDNITKKYTSSYEIEIKTKHGNIIPIEIEALEMMWKGEKIRVAALRDLTERKKAQSAIKESEERFKKLSELTFEGILFHNNGILIDANASYCRITGYSLDEIIGKDVVELMVLEKYRPIIMEKILQEHAEAYEVEIRKKNGEIIPVELEAKDIVLKGGKIRVGAVRDLTERKKAQLALIQSEINLIRAQRIAGMGSWIYFSNKDVFEWSKEMYHKLGLNPDEYDKPDFELYLSRIKPMQRKNIKILFENLFIEKPSSFEWEYTTVPINGVERFIRTEGEIEINEKGKIEKIIGTDLDITDMKQVNAELEKAVYKAEQASKYKSEFLANMSHELRTPLVGIIGFNELMLDDENLNQDQLENLRMVQKSGQKLLTILTDILEISTIEAGKMTITKKWCNLPELLEEIRHIYSLKLKEKSISLEFEYSNIEKIYTDASRLTQVLLNLIGNAMKFTNQGGIVVRIKLQGHVLTFSVEDTGIGIEEELLEKIFDSFVMGETGYTKKYSGTGLGLAICKRIVEMMSGEIWVKSAPGKGSTFYFTIPNIFGNNEETTQAFIDAKFELNYQKSKEICVLDDDMTTLKYIEKFIKSQTNHNIKTYNKAEDFLSDLIDYGSKFCDIVLLDINMPEINGVEMLQKIKNINYQIPVIAFTAYAMKSDKVKFLNLGFDDYLAKPFKTRNFIQLLSKYS